jgi:hypothetical protein
VAEKITKLGEQPKLRLDVCEVEEITDSRGEYLTDKGFSVGRK